jgi:hypothetical protein
MTYVHIYVVFYSLPASSDNNFFAIPSLWGIGYMVLLVLAALVVLSLFGLFHRQLIGGRLRRLWCQIPCISAKHSLFVQCFKCILMSLVCRLLCCEFYKDSLSRRVLAFKLQAQWVPMLLHGAGMASRVAPLIAWDEDGREDLVRTYNNLFFSKVSL